MDILQKIDVFAARLADPKVDIRNKANIASDLRDSIENLCSPAATFNKFLAKIWPVFKKILEGRPEFLPTSPEHILRNQILEVLHRLQHSSSEVEPYAIDMIDTLMALVRVENEDNAILCVKTIMDLVKHQGKVTESKVLPFLELIQEMFNQMERVVRDTFDTPTANTQASSTLVANTNGQSFQSPRPGSPATTVSDPGADKKDSVPLPKGMQSFKVLAECPITVVSIMQAHRPLVQQYIKNLVPTIKLILLLQVKAQEQAHAEAAKNHTIFTGVSKEIKNRAAFGEFITAQVKTMSFLAYLLRVYATQLQDFLRQLPAIVVRLLKDCPREKSGARKELLVAIRHIINFNYRKIFINDIDDLLDERILIGDGLTVFESMRPLAYSMLADLIHHVRESLNKDQIRRTIEVYSKNLHDSFPGSSFQTMSAKLLLNMAESIVKNDDSDGKTDARYFLVLILNAIGDKFATMNQQYNNAVKQSKINAERVKDKDLDANSDEQDQATDWDEIDIFSAMPIKTSNFRERGVDPVSDNKFLFRNLVNGLKNMFYQLRQCNPPNLAFAEGTAPSNWAEVSFGYNAEEVRVITKLFHEGARVFRYYSTEATPPDVTYASPVDFMASHSMSHMSREEKELLESFGTVFHCVDPATFHEVFQAEIPHLHDLMFEHTALLHLPQFFLASEATSPAFAGMVLQHLMNKLPDVGSSDVKRSSILLRMFKLSFMAVTLFSAHNEQVLLPHVTKIVTQCVQLSVTAEKPIHYYILLRSLFRSIGGGRFELLYKEILPLLEMLLETFNHLLQGARDQHDRDLYVELTLTVPARLSHLLPHLSHLMRPLVVALSAGPDLVGQGLRTLELCVDNLTADYLDPIMAPVMDDLMAALFEHLKPQPYVHFHSHTTMRILGKLGGRSRKSLTKPPELDYRPTTDDDPSFDVRLRDTNQTRPFPLGPGLDLAIRKLSDTNRPTVYKNNDLHYKQQAFQMISAYLKIYIGFDQLPDDFAALLRLQATDLCEGRFETYANVLDTDMTTASLQKQRMQEEILKKLLKACITAATIEDLGMSAPEMVTSICKHFTIVELGQALADAGRRTQAFDVNTGEGARYLSTKIFADVIVECFASDNVSLREVAKQALLTVRATAITIFGDPSKADRLPFFSHLVYTFCAKCREVEWFTKAGAALAVKFLVTSMDLSQNFVMTKKDELIKALLFVIKDTPPEVPASTRIVAQDTLNSLVHRVCASLEKDSVSDDKSVLHGLCNVFVTELAHMNHHVRMAAQQAFAIIATETGAEVWELIMPVRDRLLPAIFNKPLRALPFLTQTGFIDAITYALNLGHDLVPLNDQLHRLMMESLALADAEAEILHPKPDEHNNAELIKNLRVSCLKLLSMALGLQDFAASQQNSRARIISVFFKLLYSKSKEIIDAANAGLKEVLALTNKLPKDLLQNGLRPILMNLQDSKRLTVAGLEGLARLLTLLTTYFKVEIGSRLLEHMKSIADDALLQRVSFALVEQHEKIKIVAAILNIFHLLPAAATTFMNELVDSVLDLESRLRRTTDSPFRLPIILYLNKYPSESWSFFQQKFSEEKYGRFFGQVLANPNSTPLRIFMQGETDHMIRLAFEASVGEARNIAVINAIFIVYSVSMHEDGKSWLSLSQPLRKFILSAGKDLEMRLKKDMLVKSQRLRAVQAGDQVNYIVMQYLSLPETDMDLMWEYLGMHSLGELRSNVNLTQFLYKRIICSTSTVFQRTAITRGLDTYHNKQISPRFKAFVLHYIVSPIFARDIQLARKDPSHTTIFDETIAELVHDRLWKASSETTDEWGLPGIDHARMEAFQLSAFTIKYHKDAISEARKDLIKYAWASLRLEDTINKYASYVLMAYFLCAYDTPFKICMQIYNQLLKAHQNEGKGLVTQALDLLAPILPTKLAIQAAPQEQKGRPAWARIPRKILNEETGNLQQVQSIFSFIARQPSLFYESRDYFAVTMISTLHKIAPPVNNSTDGKRLALSLVQLVLTWEKKRLEKNSSQTPKRDTNGQTVATSDAKDDWNIPLEQRTLCIKYLITFITALPDRYPVPAASLPQRLKEKPQQQQTPPIDLCKKAVDILQQLLVGQIWPDVDIGLYEKAVDVILTSEKAEKPDEKHTVQMINALQVVRILLSTKNKDWIVNHIDVITKLLDKSLRSDDPEIQDCLHQADVENDVPGLMRQVLEAIPQARPDEEDAMELDNAALDFVTKYSKIYVAETLSSGNLVAGINNLWTLSLVRPNEVDDRVGELMRTLQGKLAKDHLNAYATPVQQPLPGWRPGEPNMEAYEFALGIDLLKKSIDILSSRMATLGDNRRPFLSILASLVEKSLNVDVCNKVLDMVEKWVFDPNEAWPTLKEKTAVLHKMLVFEKWPKPELLERFLELVLKIYEDRAIARTELTVRLEHAFLIGTRAKDVKMRTRFMNIFNNALSESANKRLEYVLTVQNWDTLADSFWLKQASQLLAGSLDMSASVKLHHEDVRVCPISRLFSATHIHPDNTSSDLVVEESLEEIAIAQKKFNQELHDVRARHILEPLVQLQHVDDNTAYDLWVKLFKLFWSCLAREERVDLEKGMVTLLTREYHQRQLTARPNVVQALLEGAVRARPRFKVPPHVMKFLSRHYDAWYTTLVSLEGSAVDPLIDTATVRESNLDALVEVYAGLQEDDLFYGTWRRRCKFMETNAALSYEQHGMWDKAQQLWEAAQVKARTGVVPFSQGEYYIWEDHWIICAQKLQQWDILGEFAKHENFNDLLLEATWRNIEAWSNEDHRNSLNNMIKSVSDSPTPRRAFFQAFMALLQYNNKAVSRPEFQHICDEATQLSIRKWHQLPKRLTNAHIPILQNFQQLVELHDASVICDSLMSTNERNLDSKSQEVKLLLQAWRDRLPNIWDDINAWQDLVTWRQHVFQLVNGTYLSLIPNAAGQNAGNNSYAYRGYHETAWIINKFAHVARKHNMADVCIAQLGKIYTLPNIEIQEAFLKLREQAKCYYQNDSELHSGLDVINNTNLNYFGPQQKAEFFTLKGMFLAKLKQVEEADEAFGVALYYDLRLAKAWAEWGQYCDRKFKENPKDMDAASNAVVVYLEAAGLYKSHKSRKMLSRVLWLLSLDDKQGAISKAFTEFKGDVPVWYWTTFIPQLLGSLEHKEAELVKVILMKIAKQFPQALFYHLRAAREEFMTKKKQFDLKQQAKEQKDKQQGAVQQTSSGSRPATATGSSAGDSNVAAGSPPPKQEPNGDVKMQDTPAAVAAASLPPTDQKSDVPKKPWDHAEDVMSSLKTAFPLLALSMETMTDQISKHFKCPPDEDAHRLIVALLNDGLAYIGRSPQNFAVDAKLPEATESNITRFAETVLPSHLRTAFEADFVNVKPTMVQYIHKLRRWREKLEQKLDHRQQWAPLEGYSHHLSEFKFLKFDDSVEVPGQYQLHRDKNTDFVRIERFMPTVRLVRGNGVCHRRLTVRGHDGTLHPFAVQHPTGRNVRREERITQLFRIFNETLKKKKEARRRNLVFHVPIIVPIAPHIRLVQDDASYVTLQSVFEDYCRQSQQTDRPMSRDDPILYLFERTRASIESHKNKTSPGMSTGDLLSLSKTEIFLQIQERFMPTDIALRYFQSIYPSYSDFWLFRKTFTHQFASTTFLTYVMHMSARYPSKLAIARHTGQIWATDLLPFIHTHHGTLAQHEAVPFRLTPSLQTLMGPLGIEGIFTASLMAIARCLAENDNGVEMEQTLQIFVRDEMFNWISGRNGGGGHGGLLDVGKLENREELRKFVGLNTNLIVRRAIGLATTQGKIAAMAASNVNNNAAVSGSSNHPSSDGNHPPSSAGAGNSTSHATGAGSNAVNATTPTNSLATTQGVSISGVLPACQNVVDLISKATDPHKLGAMDGLWVPWL